MEANQHSLTERGYELDHESQEAQNRANTSAVELERAAARELGNTERVGELEARLASSAVELEQTQTQLVSIADERTQQRTFLETAAGDAKAFRQKVEARQQEARVAAEEVVNGERQMEITRLHTIHLLTMARNPRNSVAHSTEILPALDPT